MAQIPHGQNRILSSQATLTALMRADLLAALVVDLNVAYEYSRTIDDTYDFISASGNAIAYEINLATRFFEKSFSRPALSESVLNVIRESYPMLLAKLHEWEFPVGAVVPSLVNDDLGNFDSGHITFVSLGSIGFSFGSNTYLFAFLIARLLLRLPCRLIIYLPPNELGVFTELSLRADKAYSFIIARDLFSYEFSFRDFIEYRRSGGLKFMFDYVKLALNNFYDMQSSLVGGKTIPYRVCSPSDTNLALMRLVSGAFLRKLGFKEPRYVASDPRLSGIISNRPIALIANRDHVWAGPSQPWRDSHIKSFRKAIVFLLSRGYSVVRLNIFGEQSCFVADHFYDLASLSGMTPEIQMELIAMSEFIIGCDTGLTGVAQLGGSLPTLVVDGSDCKPHAPWSHVICHTKKLEIDNEALFQSIDKESLKSVLFSSSSIWDHGTCRKVGLSLVGLSEEQILIGVEEFLDCIANNKWSAKQSLCKLGLTSIAGFDTLLSSQTADMLASLLREKSTNL